MPLSQADKQHLHSLVEKYYPKKIDKETGEIIPIKARAACIRCGHKAILGVRGQAKGLCKKCRKGDTNHAV